MSYVAKVYRKQGGEELVVADGGTITVESGGAIEIESGGSLTNAGTTYVVTDPDDVYLTVDGDDEITLADDAKAMLVHTVRARVDAAGVNAGTKILDVSDAYKVRMVDCTMIAIGGTAGGATGVQVKCGSTVLINAAVAGLGQSVVARAGATHIAVLANGASFVAQGAGDDVIVIKDGSDLTTATHIDVIFSYVLEAAE